MLAQQITGKMVVLQGLAQSIHFIVTFSALILFFLISFFLSLQDMCPWGCSNSSYVPSITSASLITVTQSLSITTYSEANFVVFPPLFFFIQAWQFYQYLDFSTYSNPCVCSSFKIRLQNKLTGAVSYALSGISCNSYSSISGTKLFLLHQKCYVSCWLLQRERNYAEHQFVLLMCQFTF